jgi:hypothetical protein
MLSSGGSVPARGTRFDRRRRSPRQRRRRAGRRGWERGQVYRQGEGWVAPVGMKASGVLPGTVRLEGNRPSSAELGIRRE